MSYFGTLHLLNFKATVSIENFMPLFLSTVLFDLSIDYHMLHFIRVKEACAAGRSNE